MTDRFLIQFPCSFGFGCTSTFSFATTSVRYSFGTTWSVLFHRYNVWCAPVLLMRRVCFLFGCGPITNPVPMLVWFWWHPCFYFCYNFKCATRSVPHGVRFFVPTTSGALQYRLCIGCASCSVALMIEPLSVPHPVRLSYSRGWD